MINNSSLQELAKSVNLTKFIELLGTILDDSAIYYSYILGNYP